MASSRWTDGDLAKLTEMYVAGRSWTNIGQEFKRSPQACKEAFNRRCPSVPRRKHGRPKMEGEEVGIPAWTKDRDEKLIKLYKAGSSWAVIALALGISQTSGYRRLLDLGFSLARKSPWTKADDDKLIEMYDENYSFVEIGNALNRTSRACGLRIRILGHEAKRRRLWSNEDIQKVEQLCNEGAYLNEIAEKLNRSPSAIDCVMRAHLPHLTVPPRRRKKLNVRDALIVAIGALQAIEELPGEINTSNYTHDDVCALNDAYIEIYHIAKAALEKIAR